MKGKVKQEKKTRNKKTKKQEKEKKKEKRKKINSENKKKNKQKKKSVEPPGANAILCPSGHENPKSKTFCRDCGKPLKGESGEVEIVSFSLDDGETVMCEEDDWDELRRLVTSRFAGKEESTYELPDFQHEPEGILVLENWVNRVCPIQDSIRSQFRNGMPLETLIQDLQDRIIDPMTDANMVLRVASAAS